MAITGKEWPGHRGISKEIVISVCVSTSMLVPLLSTYKMSLEMLPVFGDEWEQCVEDSQGNSAGQ